MTITIRCDQCRRTLKVGDQHAGKRAKCPGCDTILSVPEIGPAADGGKNAGGKPGGKNPPRSAARNTKAAVIETGQSAGSVRSDGDRVSASGAAAAINVAAPAKANQRRNAAAAGMPAAAVPSLEATPGAATAAGDVGLRTAGVPAMGGNPYAVSGGAGGEGVVAGRLEEFRPLYEAVFFINAAGWTLAVVGGLYCLTIIGIVQGGLMLWMGLSLKSAGENLKLGFETNNRLLLRESASKFATYFRIIGVLLLILAGVLALVVGLFVLIFLVGLIGAASQA